MVIQTTLQTQLPGELLPAFAASPQDLANDRFLRAARSAGVLLDQLLNFLRVGVALQPKQCQASVIARQMDSPGGPEELGYGGARGGGKSHWMLAQMGADDCQRYPGLKCLLLRKVGKSLQEAFRDLLVKCLGHKSLLGYTFTASSGQLNFRNGSQIILGHFQNEGDIDKYLGLEYDAIGIEEATTLTKEKIENIGSCNRSSKTFLVPDGRGGLKAVKFRPRIYTTTNPGGVGHAYYKEHFVDPFKAGTESFTRFLPATARDNGFNNPEYIGRLERLTGWRKRAWLDGDWNIAAGQYFTTWREDHHTVDPKICESVLRSARRIWMSMDYGTTHYTVFYLFAQDSDGEVYICAEHAERKWLPQRHCQSLTEMLARMAVRRSKVEAIKAGGDVFQERGDDLVIAEKYAEAGFELERANNSRINGWFELQNRLGDPDPDKPENFVKPTLHVSKNCRRLISCLPSLQHDPKRPEDVKKVDTDEEGDGGDDPADSARYGVMHVASEAAASESLDAGG